MFDGCLEFIFAFFGIENKFEKRRRVKNWQQKYRNNNKTKKEKKKFLKKKNYQCHFA